MILPPLPLDPNGQEWADDEAKIIQAYALLTIKEYKASVSLRQSHRKYLDDKVERIRTLASEGLNYKQVNKYYPMSEVTFINIIHRRGAYK